MSEPPSFQVLIVDDEPLARQAIRVLVEADSTFRVIGECRNGTEAVTALREQSPDVLFLDIQMPEMNGFEVLQTVGAPIVPVVVFITAFDEFALQAFEVFAFDYLLKPINTLRFRKTLDRVKDQLWQKQVQATSRRLASLLEHYQGRHSGQLDSAEVSPRYLQRVAVKTGHRLHLVAVDEIDWIDAEAQYSQLHVGEQSHLIRTALHVLESQLDPKLFFRIHRSLLVNLRRVVLLENDPHGDGLVQLCDGTKLKVARSRREALETALTWMM